MEFVMIVVVLIFLVIGIALFVGIVEKNFGSNKSGDTNISRDASRAFSNDPKTYPSKLVGLVTSVKMSVDGNPVSIGLKTDIKTREDAYNHVIIPPTTLILFGPNKHIHVDAESANKIYPAVTKEHIKIVTLRKIPNQPIYELEDILLIRRDELQPFVL